MVPWNHDTLGLIFCTDIKLLHLKPLMTDLHLLVNPLILRPIAWLPLNPYNLARHQGSASEWHNRRDNHCVPSSSPKALLTEIQQWLCLEFGCNIRSSLSEPPCTDWSTPILINCHWSQHFDRPTSILITSRRLSTLLMISHPISLI